MPACISNGRRLIRWWWVGLVLVGAGHAAVVYQNLSTDLDTRLETDTLEVGDEIILDRTERYLTRFRFSYFGLTQNPVTNEFTGAVSTRIRFYHNDGEMLAAGVSTPGTCFFDSGPFAVRPSPRAAIELEDFVRHAEVPLLDRLPNAFTWSIQFSGLDAGDRVGVDLFSPPAVGNNYPDYWVRPGSNWTFHAGTGPNIDFAASLEAEVDPAIRLTINRAGPVLALSWPAMAGAGSTLHQAADCVPPIAWVPFETNPVLVDGFYSVSVSADGPSRLFALLPPPTP